MAGPNVCPFCGQALVDRAAIQHLHHEQQKFEQRLRQEAKKELAASLRPQLTAQIRKDLDKAYKRLDKNRENVIRELREQNTKIRQRAKQAEKEAATRLRPQLAAQIRGELEGTYGRRDRMKDRTIEQLQGKVDEMQRRLEQTDAGDRGELSEEDLLQSLQQAFQKQGDDIARVGRGRAGADIIHKVLDRAGGEQAVAGTIVYESKDTLKWQEGFVTQAREARERYGTPHVVVVSRAFPRKERELSWRDGVPIVHPARAVPLAHVIRKFIVEMHRAGLSGQDVTRKTEELYTYIRSEKFLRTLSDIIEMSGKLGAALESEKRQHKKLWLHREQAYSSLAEKSDEIDEAIRAIVERAAVSERSHPSTQGEFAGALTLGMMLGRGGPAVTTPSRFAAPRF